jgi:hypothetical protein
MGKNRCERAHGRLKDHMWRECGSKWMDLFSINMEEKRKGGT